MFCIDQGLESERHRESPFDEALPFATLMTRFLTLVPCACQSQMSVTDVTGNLYYQSWLHVVATVHFKVGMLLCLSVQAWDAMQA